MNTEKRREILMKRLREAKQPLTGTKLARELGVSRQIIVGDISILRAEGTQIFATPRGYIMPQEAGDKFIKATIVCRHDAAAMEKSCRLSSTTAAPCSTSSSSIPSTARYTVTSLSRAAATSSAS